MSNSIIAKRYTRLLALWPKDPLRPNLPFTRTIEYRGTPFDVTPIDPAADTQSKASTRPTPTKPAAPTDPQAEQANINALFSLLENRYSKTYPMSAGVLKPASNPEYYDRLMEEIERAPSKSWLRAKLDEWKMKIRWK